MTASPAKQLPNSTILQSKYVEIRLCRIPTTSEIKVLLLLAHPAQFDTESRHDRCLLVQCLEWIDVVLDRYELINV